MKQHFLKLKDLLFRRKYLTQMLMDVFFKPWEICALENANAVQVVLHVHDTVMFSDTQSILHQVAFVKLKKTKCNVFSKGKICN